MELLNAGFSTYLLVFLAEFGDKSQIICLVLAARHRPWPVFIGALLAFVLLTGLAAFLGSALTFWIPDVLLQWVVAILFLVFGIRLLLSATNPEKAQAKDNPNYSILFNAFALIALSEMGDKTQLLVVGLSTVEPAWIVFLGATMALITTSALGVWAGSRLVGPISLKWVHRAGALLFILFALATGYRAYLAI